MSGVIKHQQVKEKQVVTISEEVTEDDTAVDETSMERSSPTHTETDSLTELQNDGKWKRYKDTVSGQLALEKLRVSRVRRDKTRLETAIQVCDDQGLNETDEYNEALIELDAIKAARLLQEACERKDAAQIRERLQQIHDAGFDRRLRYEVIKATYVLKKADESRQVGDAWKSRLTMDRSTVCEIRRYQHPSDSLHATMRAVLLLFRHDEITTQDWRYVKRFCNPSDESGLYKQLLVFDVEKIYPEIAARSKEMLMSIDVDKLRGTSGAAASFYVWAMGVINEVEERNQGQTVEPADAARQKVIFGEHRKQKKKVVKPANKEQQLNVRDN